MRGKISVVAALGGLSMALSGTSAMALNCGGVYLPACPVTVATPVPAPVIVAPAPPVIVETPTYSVECTHYITENCDTPVKVIPSRKRYIDPMVVTTSHPMDHLRRFSFKGSPHVNIMRVYGETAVAELEDSPAAFSGGCSPESTQYCRSEGTASEIVSAGLPASSPSGAPYIAPPAPTAGQSRTYGSLSNSSVSVTGSHSVTAPPQTQVQHMAPQAMTSQHSWGRVSGPTMVGNMPATQIVCRQPNQPVPPAMPITSLPPLCPGPVAMPQHYGTSLGWAGGSVGYR